MEKVILVLAIVFALFILVKRVRSLTGESVCSSCDGQCQGCQIKNCDENKQQSE